MSTIVLLNSGEILDLYWMEVYPIPIMNWLVIAKIQCRLQELWPLEGHSVKTQFFGGDFFFSYRHHILFAKSFPVILSSENIYVHVLWVFHFIYLQDLYQKKQTSAAVFSKSNEYYLSTV